MTAPEPYGRRRRSAGVPSRWRRRVFWTLLAGLVAGNVWLLRRQFPSQHTRMNEEYDRALHHMERDRDYVRAEKEFRNVLEIRDDPGVRVLLGIALQAQGKSAEARAEYLAVLARSPGEDRARIGIAEIALAEQDYDEVFRQLAAAQAEDPTPVEAYLIRGSVLREVGDIDGALAEYRRAIVASPSSYEAHLAMGDLLTLRSFLTGDETARQSAAGSYREAEGLIKSRLVHADDRRQRMDLARSIAGQVRLFQERDLGEAVRQLRELAAADTTDPQPTLLLGQFLHETGNDVEARRALEDAATRWPGPVTAVILHEFYATVGEWDLAQKTLTDAIARDREDLSIRGRLVAYLFVQGKIDEAAAEVANAAAILPGDWRVHELHGDLARERVRAAVAAGRTEGVSQLVDESLAAYRKALEGRPRSPRLKKKLAGQLIEGVLAKGTPGAEPTPDEQLARRLIEEVLRVNRTDAEALEWHAQLLLADGRSREAADALRPLADAPQPSISALRLLGVAASKIGDDGAAADAMLRVIEILAPRDGNGRRDARRAGPADWCNAIHAASMAGRVDVAVRIAREAAEAWGESARVAAALGSAALAQGDAAGAIAALTAARARFPDDAPIRLLLASAYERAGRIDDAAKEFEAAATESGSDEARIRYLEFLVRAGRVEHAEQGFLSLIAADPSNAAARVRLGDFYLAARPPRRDAALREYEAARGLEPSDPAPLLRIADLRIADARTDPKAYADAEAAAAEFERRAPEDPHVLYLRGKLALVGGRNDEAAEALRAFVAARPERAAGHFFLGVALRTAGRLEDALEPLEKAARLSPGDATMRLDLAALHFDLGVKAFQRGDFEAARQLFARADAGGVENGAKLFVAGAAANAGNLDVSEAECRALLESDPKHRGARQLLATLLLRKGTKEALAEAYDLYRAILAAEPEDLMAALGIGTVKFFQGFPKEALADLLRVYPRTNGSADVALAICRCHAAAGDLKSAVEFLDAESAARPEHYGFPQLKGDFLVKLRQYEPAVEAYLEASRRAPKMAGPVLAAASALIQMNRMEDARKLLVERQPGSSEPALFSVALGDVLAHMDRLEEAQESLQRALVAIPGHGRALYLLGRIAERQSRPAEALKLYRAAAERGTADADCHARLAHLLAAERDFAGARDAWRAALRLAPRDPKFLNSFALILGREDDRLDEAIQHARIATAVAPERPEIADTLGWLLFRAGKYEEAANVLAPAAELLPRVPEVQFHAGMALLRSGRRPEARVHLDRALTISQTFEGSDTAKAELDRLR